MRVAWVVLAACGRIDFDPIPPVPPADVPQMSLGSVHACERTAAGALYCWGRNNNGQLGVAALYGTVQKAPVQVEPLTSWTAVTSGNTSTCALDAQGRAFCWGADDAGQLGIAPSSCGDGVVEPASGETCDDGNNASGDGCNALCQTTPATPADVRAPATVTGDRSYVAICTGSGQSCAIGSDGTLWCWGSNTQGQLGLGDEQPRSFPQQVGTASNWTAVSCGGNHTCGLQDDKSLWCWGSNAKGELGATTDHTRPGLVAPGTTWRQVGAGDDYECAIGDDLRGYCLGANDTGQLGFVDLVSRTTPTIFADRQFDRIGVGDSQACARSSDGSLFCWGDDSFGNIGDGSIMAVSPPAQVPGIWTAIAGGTDFSCALDAQLATWCWGRGLYGRLGDGTGNDSATPVLVELP